MAIAYKLFPRGIAPDEPGYELTPQVRHQIEARERARASAGTFGEVLRRLSERFPGRVEDRSDILQPATGTGQDRCFSGAVDLPLRQPGEARHTLEFLVSFVAPYHVIYSVRGLPDASGSPMRACSFHLSLEELSQARVIQEELESSFPGYEPLPEEVASLPVPDLVVYPWSPVRIIGCLFSDDWLRRAPNADGLWVWASRLSTGQF